MSHGPGSRERQLLHELYLHPRVARNGRRFIRPSDYAGDETAYTALQRAARSLVAKGLVRQPFGFANDLEPLPETPLSVQKSPDCRRCEHLEALSRGEVR